MEKNGVSIDEVVESYNARQIHINLHSEDGFGHITSLRVIISNWVEFEAVVREFESFYKYFEFERLPCFDKVEDEDIVFMTSRNTKTYNLITIFSNYEIKRTSHYYGNQIKDN